MNKKMTWKTKTFKERMHQFLSKGVGKKMKIFIYVLLLVSMIGNGFSENQGTKKAFKIIRVNLRR